MIKIVIALLISIILLFPLLSPAEDWIQTSETCSSYVNCLDINYQDYIFAGTNNGGVFRTIDGGDNWVQINNGLTDINIFAIAINDSGDVFVGTSLSGVFRSTDNGENWEQINNGLTGLIINAIAIGPSGEIVVATDAAYDLFRSTDNGDSWTQLTNGPFYAGVSSLVINDSGHIFAGACYGVNGVGGGIYRSIDDGDTWDELSIIGGTLTTCVEALSISPNGEIYAGTGSSYYGIFHSADNGDSWNQINGNLPNLYIRTIVTKPHDYIYVGTGGNGIYRSTNNGNNWYPMNDSLTNPVINTININSDGDFFTGTSGSGVFRTKFTCGVVATDNLSGLAQFYYLIKYLYLSNPGPPIYEAGDVDGLKYITNSDVYYLYEYYYRSGASPICPSIGGPDFPISHSDTLYIKYLKVLPWENQARIDLWVKNSSDIAGFTLPLSYNCETSNITCDSVSFINTIYGPDSSGFNLIDSAIIDTAENKILIAIDKFFPSYDEYLLEANRRGLLGSMWFTLESSVDTQYVNIETTIFTPSNRAVFIRETWGDGPAPFAFRQTMVYDSSHYSCYDSDDDGYGDPDHPENTCEPDNCPDIYNLFQINSDSDQFGDSCDNCIHKYNPDQEDIDADGYGDSCDNCIIVYNPSQEDLDGDNVGDSCDNCLTEYNPQQEDNDSDLLGDSCDNCPIVYNPNQEDIDADSVGDSCDNCIHAYNPGQEDFDENGVGDACDSLPPPVLDLSTHGFFADTTAFYPSAGDGSTIFEFRINYFDSAGYWPLAGYPRMSLDWDGNGSIDHPNDGYYTMSLSEVDSIVTDGVDYSVFLALSAGGNPQIKFDALSSVGLAATYPEAGWLAGPAVIDTNSTDLYIYADDITYSNYPAIPQVDEPVSIGIKVHNNSPIAYDSVDIYFYINDILVQTYVEQIPERNESGTPGAVDVNFDTVFSVEALLELKVEVDPNGEIAEWNESNNTALRSLYIGSIELPGNIHINADSLGSYYPMTYVYGGGSAWYEADGDSLEQVSGAPAFLTLSEGDVDLGTVYVNDYGFFNYSFITPQDQGLYHIQIVITDFTLTDTAVVPFNVLSTDGIDLIIDFELNGFPLDICNNTILTIDSAMVHNIGSTASGPCKAAILQGNDTVYTDNVPALDPGESYTLSSLSVPVDHSVSGSYIIRGIVDYDNEVNEVFETNNNKIYDYDVWCCPEDLTPQSITLGGIAYQGIPINVSALVCNHGAVPANDFGLILIDSTYAGLDTFYTAENLSLSAYGACTWATAANHVFDDTGLHKITAVADPLNEIDDECSEDNNIYWRFIYVEEAPEPDLVIQSEWIVPSEIYPDSGDTFCILNTDVYNTGQGTAYDVYMLYLMDSDTLGEIIRIDSIPNYGVNNYSASQPSECVPVISCEPPLHIFRVCADPFDSIQELWEDNNCGTKSIVFCPSPDLYISEILYSPACADTGEVVDLIAKIGNAGNVAASALIEFFYLDNPEGGWSDTIFVDSVTVDSIESMTDTSQAIVQWTKTLDYTRIYVKILNSVPVDINTDNNDASVLLTYCYPAEVNGDSTINIFDITYLISYLYISGPEPTPFPICCGDPNCDCTVNIFDVTYIISYLYLSGPAPCNCEDWISSCGWPLRK